MATGPLTPDDTPDPEIRMVLASYAAFARGDIAAAVAPLHEDVEWLEPQEFPMGGVRRGRAAVAEYLDATRRSWSRLESTPTASRHGEDIVVLHHVRGELADGTPHEATVADVFTVAGGRVVRMVAYTDPSQVS